MNREIVDFLRHRTSSNVGFVRDAHRRDGVTVELFHGKNKATNNPSCNVRFILLCARRHPEESAAGRDEGREAPSSSPPTKARGDCRSERSLFLSDAGEIGGLISAPAPFVPGYLRVRTELAGAPAMMPS
jgi:hypothetical protein